MIQMRKGKRYWRDNEKAITRRKTLVTRKRTNTQRDNGLKQRRKDKHTYR